MPELNDQAQALECDNLEEMTGPALCFGSALPVSRAQRMRLILLLGGKNVFGGP